MAIQLAIGKKRSGKSTLLRRLAYRRLKGSPGCLIFYHDPKEQVRGGRVFSSAAEAAASFRVSGVPRLSIFRDNDVDAIAALARRTHGVTLILDELDRACDGKAFTSPEVKKIVHEGRQDLVDLWGTFRSTRNVNEDLIGQADIIYLMHHSDADYFSLQTLRRRLGPVADKLTSLEPMQFVIWQD